MPLASNGQHMGSVPAGQTSAAIAVAKMAARARMLNCILEVDQRKG